MNRRYLQSVLRLFNHLKTGLLYLLLLLGLLSSAHAQTRTNVALQANGGLATASSIWTTGYEPGSANNGVRTGAVWGAGGGWHDNSPGVFPDWLQITFNSSKTIDEVNVYSIQDNYANPSEPTATSSFTLYGLAAFEVQSWNGTTWVTVPNGAISNNNLVWRKVSFPAITTDRIRVLVTNGLSSYSRIAEVEAYGVSSTANAAPTISLSSPSNNSSTIAPANLTLTANAADSDGTITKVEFYNGATLLNTDTTAPYSYSLNAIAGSYTLSAKATDNLGASTTSAVVNVTVNPTPSTTRSNVALQANGGLATASSIWANGYEPGSANNGVRTGAVWGAGGGWHDNSPGVFPDWLQITFNSSKTIDEVNVYSIQDNYANPSEPTATSSFTLYGLAAFEVQSWNGTTWVTVPNGVISNNTLVWRKVSFPAITTDRIRILVTNGLSSYSRIAEVEVYAASVNPGPTASSVYYVFADHLNTARVITDTSNKTVWRWDSDPFGTDGASEDPDGDGRRFTYNHRFPGQYWDKETALHYNYLRDGYDSSIGRYTQSDPIGLLGGINTYGYANQNPLSFIDPTGLDFQFGPSISGALFGPLTGNLAGGSVGVSGGIGIGISTDGTLGGTSIYGQIQGNGIAGAGVFGGIGIQGNVGNSDGPATSGTTVSPYFEANIGRGAGAGVSGNLDANGRITGGGGSVRGFPGTGYGAMVGGGVSTTTTLVSPTIGEILDRIRKRIRRPSVNTSCQ